MGALSVFVGVLVVGAVGYCLAMKKTSTSNTVSDGQVSTLATVQPANSGADANVTPGAIVAKGTLAYSPISSVASIAPNAQIRTGIVPQTFRFQRLS